MTDQELFTKVATHLLTQGARSIGPTDCQYPPGCQYRGAAERMCAAGCLIADEFYVPELEGFTVGDHTVRTALLRSGVISTQLDLVEALQNTHDTHMPDVWADKLSKQAADRGLEMPVL